MMKSTTYSFANLCLNIVYGLVLLSATIHFLTMNKDWVGEEFFINYTGGFIRRGLIGSILYLADTLFDIPGIAFVRSFTIMMLLLNLILISGLMISKKLDLFILLSSFLTLNIYSWYICFRLDLMIIPLMTVQLWLLQKKEIKKTVKIIFTAVLLSLGVLIHEVYFPLTAFTLFYVLYFKLKNNRLVDYFFIFIPGFILFILSVTLFKGTSEQVDIMLNSWENYNVNPQKLSYLKWLFSLGGPIYIWQNAAFIKNKLYYLGFSFNWILVCFFFLLYILHFFRLNSSKLIFIAGNFLVILLLCLVATDFIRWYYMVFLQVLFYFIIFENREKNTVSLKYLFLKFLILFIGLPLYGWTPTHFYWTAPVKYLIDLKDYF